MFRWFQDCSVTRIGLVVPSGRRRKGEVRSCFGGRTRVTGRWCWSLSGVPERRRAIVAIPQNMDESDINLNGGPVVWDSDSEVYICPPMRTCQRWAYIDSVLRGRRHQNLITFSSCQGSLRSSIQPPSSTTMIFPSMQTRLHLSCSSSKSIRIRSTSVYITSCSRTCLPP